MQTAAFSFLEGGKICEPINMNAHIASINISVLCPDEAFFFFLTTEKYFKNKTHTVHDVYADFFFFLQEVTDAD